MEAPHLLGGREFVAIGESTVEHDLRTMGLLRQCGLDQVAIGEGEAVGDYALRLLTGVLANGKTLELLGCLLIPVGVRPEQWTPAIAQETTAYIAQLTDPQDKRKVEALILSVLVDFFELGLSSSSLSPISWGQPDASGPASAATTATAGPNGAPWFAPSRATIFARRTGSSAGLSARPSWASAIISRLKRWLAGATRSSSGRSSRPTRASQGGDRHHPQF